MEHFKQFTFKQFGYLDFDGDLAEKLQRLNLADFIKIVFVKAGGTVVIDFQTYELSQDALFFINVGQYHRFDSNCSGTVIYYNRDFYCVEIHDTEVACDGILFHNVYEIPMVSMAPDNAAAMQRILAEIKREFETGQSSMEEMLRILLKQLIISSTRLWKKDHAGTASEAKPDFDFSRKFSQMVEWNFRNMHTVAEYATLLNISPKALNKRITRYSETSPNEIIKDRILLEAKRLLAHTELSVKEIGYKLGYDDTSYFIRMFSTLVLVPPLQFRQHYQVGK